MFDYVVNVFDPDTTGPDTIVPVISGPDDASVGQPTGYTFVPVPKATGYELRRGPYSALTDVDGAENGLAQFTADVSSGYNVVVGSPVASGQAAFHLAHAAPVTQTLTYNRLLLPGADAQLRFESRLGWATPQQLAVVEVQVDGTSTWNEVYSQAGTDSAGELGFNTRTVSLAPYADHPLHVRFSYVLLSGSYFPQTTTGVGWYIDDVGFDNTEELTSVAITTLPNAEITQLNAESFEFTPSAAGDYALEVRPQFYGAYFLGMGPVKRVVAGTAMCPGDCDGSGSVGVDEIIVLVNVALASAPASACAAGDTNHDGKITVDEILAAVNAALAGCPK